MYLVILLSLLTAPVAASGQGLDPAFGEDGRVATAVDALGPEWGNGIGLALRPESYGEEVHLASAPDGSLVAARGNLLLRYLPDGRLDPSFGAGGKLAIPTVEELPFGLADIAVDAQGRILVFGTVVEPTISRTIYGYTIREVSPSFVTVLRFSPNGTLDPSFGNGDGIFRDGLGLRPTPGVPAEIPLVEAESAELDSQGRPVVAVGKVGFPPSIRTTPGWVGDAMIRLTPSGTLDPSFGGGDGVIEGLLQGSREGENRFVGFCISKNDEPIVATGRWLSRLHPNGTLDRTFGRDGIAQARGSFGPLACTASHIFTLALQGTSFFPTRDDPSIWRVVRRSADRGNVNRSFDRKAEVRLRGRYSELSSLLVDRHGRVLLAGTERLATPRKKGTRSFFAVVRLLATGRRDTSFGRNGWARTSFGQDASIHIGAAAAIEALGNVAVLGSARASRLQPAGVVLARYLADH